ncbi:hypothetical protein MYO4S_00142 [Serratia phage 4S]|nr:hypothetical protein MYO4S_00142 [Serratia phage 4S]
MNMKQQIEKETYEILQAYVGSKVGPDLINTLISVRSNINTTYKNQYYVELVPTPNDYGALMIKVNVHTVH